MFTEIKKSNHGFSVAMGQYYSCGNEKVYLTESESLPMPKILANALNSFLRIVFKMKLK